MMIWLWKEERSAVTSLFTGWEAGHHHLDPPLVPDWRRGRLARIDRIRGEAARIGARAAHDGMKRQVRLAERDLDEAERWLQSRSVVGDWSFVSIAESAVNLAELRLHGVHSALTYDGPEARALGASARLFSPVTTEGSKEIRSPYSVERALAWISRLQADAAALRERAGDDPLVEQVQLAEGNLAEAGARLANDVLSYPLLMALAEAAGMLAGARLNAVAESLRHEATERRDFNH